MRGARSKSQEGDSPAGDTWSDVGSKRFERRLDVASVGSQALCWPYRRTEGRGFANRVF